LAYCIPWSLGKEMLYGLANLGPDPRNRLT
jgi:hypothetical protein